MNRVAFFYPSKCEPHLPWNHRKIILFFWFYLVFGNKIQLKFEYFEKIYAEIFCFVMNHDQNRTKSHANWTKCRNQSNMIIMRWNDNMIAVRPGCSRKIHVIGQITCTPDIILKLICATFARQTWWPDVFLFFFHVDIFATNHNNQLLISLNYILWIDYAVVFFPYSNHLN